MYHFESSMVFGAFIFKEFNNITIKGPKKQNNSKKYDPNQPSITICVCKELSLRATDV